MGRWRDGDAADARGEDFLHDGYKSAPAIRSHWPVTHSLSELIRQPLLLAQSDCKRILCVNCCNCLAACDGKVCVSANIMLTKPKTPICLDSVQFKKKVSGKKCKITCQISFFLILFHWILHIFTSVPGQQCFYEQFMMFSRSAHVN